jgi:hypothetical protein
VSLSMRGTGEAIMSELQQQGAQWTLGQRRALRLQLDRGPRELRLLAGEAWLTRSAGDGARSSEDVWLRAGQSIALASGSEVVIEAWREELRFQLLVPPMACAQRQPGLLRRWLSGWFWSSSSSSARPASSTSPLQAV